MQASCQCGAVKFTTPLAKPLKIYICHCLGCRHQSSSAFGVSVMFPAFAIPGSEHLRVYKLSTNKRNAVKCYFCGNCGSRLVHGGLEQKYVSVKEGCLEGLSAELLREAVHIWISRAIVDIPPGVYQYEEDPPEEPGQEL